MAIDNNGNIYMADYDNNRIYKFDSNGEFITKWGGTYGTGDGELNGPYGIAIDDLGYIYVADYDNCRIQKFDSNGGFITKWGSYGPGDGDFFYPWGIVVDNSGNVYVHDDTPTPRVQVFIPQN